MKFTANLKKFEPGQVWSKDGESLFLRIQKEPVTNVCWVGLSSDNLGFICCSDLDDEVNEFHGYLEKE